MYYRRCGGKTNYELDLEAVDETVKLKPVKEEM
jgi:hypothetical protein